MSTKESKLINKPQGKINDVVTLQKNSTLQAKSLGEIVGATPDDHGKTLIIDDNGEVTLGEGGSGWEEIKCGWDSKVKALCEFHCTSGTVYPDRIKWTKYGKDWINGDIEKYFWEGGCSPTFFDSSFRQPQAETSNKWATMIIDGHQYQGKFRAYGTDYNAGGSWDLVSTMYYDDLSVIDDDYSSLGTTVSLGSVTQSNKFLTTPVDRFTVSSPTGNSFNVLAYSIKLCSKETGNNVTFPICYFIFDTPQQLTDLEYFDVAFQVLIAEDGNPTGSYICDNGYNIYPFIYRTSNMYRAYQDTTLTGTYPEYVMTNTSGTDVTHSTSSMANVNKWVQTWSTKGTRIEMAIDSQRSFTVPQPTSSTKLLSFSTNKYGESKPASYMECYYPPQSSDDTLCAYGVMVVMYDDSNTFVLFGYKFDDPKPFNQPIKLRFYFENNITNKRTSQDETYVQ